jgi:hypothetical protein
MRLKQIRISKKEYESFLELEIKRRSEWWAVFSVNRREQIWPFVCYGVTPEEKRQYVSLEEYPRLHELGGNFISSVDEEGGRFFIDERGVFFIKGEKEEVEPEQFIEWRPDEPLPDKHTRPWPIAIPQPPPLSFAELRKMSRY